jgi:hypothetical protein
MTKSHNPVFSPFRVALEKATGWQWHWAPEDEVFYFGPSLPESVASIKSHIGSGEPERWSAHPSGHEGPVVATGEFKDLGLAMEAACKAVYLAKFGTVGEA